MGQLIGALAARLAQLVAMLLAVVLLCFAAMQALPGDKAVQLAVARHGERAGEDGIARASRDGGFDRPVAAQFADWAGQVLRLDLGHSLVSRRPVVDELWPRLRVTLIAGGLSVLLGVLVGVPLGAWAGLRPGGVVDGAVAVAAALFSAVPAFLLGLLLVMLFAIRLGWLPAAGGGTALHWVAGAGGAAPWGAQCGDPGGDVDRAALRRSDRGLRGDRDAVQPAGAGRPAGARALDGQAAPRHDGNGRRSD